MISSFPTNSNINESRREVALAILHQDGKLLMQLRDDFPHILLPGHWGLFGGHLELGETPEEGLRRELLEEINYSVDKLHDVCINSDENVIRYVYHAPLTVRLADLNLQEGQDLDLLTLEDIDRGLAYSHKIEQFRPLGKIHQQLLLDFLKLEL
jgi:8-oxo-dGTP diphosphatase